MPSVMSCILNTERKNKDFTFLTFYPYDENIEKSFQSVDALLFVTREDFGLIKTKPQLQFVTSIKDVDITIDFCCVIFYDASQYQSAKTIANGLHIPLIYWNIKDDKRINISNVYTVFGKDFQKNIEKIKEKIHGYNHHLLP